MDPNNEEQQIAMGLVLMSLIFCLGWIMRGFFV